MNMAIKFNITHDRKNFIKGIKFLYSGNTDKRSSRNVKVLSRERLFEFVSSILYDNGLGINEFGNIENYIDLTDKEKKFQVEEMMKLVKEII